MKGIRGKGLILGLELEIEGAKIVDACMQEGLLINCTAYKVLRFVPPLTITQKGNRARAWDSREGARAPVTSIQVMSKRDLLNFRDLTREELVRIFALATGLKQSKNRRFPIRCWPANVWR